MALDPSFVDIFKYIGEHASAIIAITGLTLAYLQIRGDRNDNRSAVIAESSWRVYDIYTTPELRKARTTAERLARQHPTMGSAEDYASTVASEPDKYDPQSEDHQMRALLRFYNQVGIMMSDGHVDTKFVNELILPGLKTTEHVVAASVRYYQRKDLSVSAANTPTSGSQTATTVQREIYDYVLPLLEQ